MVFESIAEKSFSEQELLNRKLHLARAKLHSIVELSNIFSLFCIYSTVDLNINPGDTSPELLILFIVDVSLLVVVIVLVKIAIMYITPRLETAIYMSRYDIKEYDQILHEDVLLYMEIIWTVSSVGSAFLFGLNLILIAWMRAHMFTKASAIGSTIIMVPVLVFILIFSSVSYYKIRKRNHAFLLNEEEILIGSPKIHYSKRAKTNNNNSRIANSKWDLIRSHVIKENNNHKLHIV